MTRPSGAQGRVIAFLGKGGAGKTVLSCLTGRLLRTPGRRVLLVDADPAQGLTLALGLPPGRQPTLGEVREQVIHDAGAGHAPSVLSDAIDYRLAAALGEVAGFGLLVMGASERPGCYCAVNRLLRDGIEELSRSFDDIVIDAEAGMEQVSRQVTRRVDHLLIVSDASLRGVATARAITETLERLGGPPPLGVILNRTDDATPEHHLAAAGLSRLGRVPGDPAVARHDREGRSLLDLPEGSPALTALAEILRREPSCLLA